MLNSLFPITDNWSSYTFVLYLSVTFITTLLCKAGAKHRTNGELYIDEKRNRGFTLRVRVEMICYFVAFVILVLIATLRSYHVGPDTSVYVGYFLNKGTYLFNIQNLFTFNQTEPGFQIYLLLIQSITTNYHVFFLVTYSMIAFSYIRFIRYFFDRNSNYIILEIFIFYYVSNMSGMRSAMGMIFLLPSFIALDEKRYIKSFILTLLATCFHYTMAINLLVIFLVWILSGSMFKKKRWVLPVSIIMVSIVAYFGLTNIYGVIATTKYNFYHVTYENLSLIGSVGIILLAVFTFANYRSIANLLEENNRTLGILNIVVSFLIMYPIIYLTGAYRVPNYYALPRLKMWSTLSELLYERIGERGIIVVKIALQIFVILYLLFKFTRMSESGSFAYVL